MATCKTLLRLGILLALASLFALHLSCGGKSSRAPGILLGDGSTGTEAPVAPSSQPDLVMLKDASGAPTGVKVYWWRVNEDDVIGYYIYRDTNPITEPDQSLRVNGGAIIHQPDGTEQAVLFDDMFAAQIGSTYYYRLTAVDYGWDESLLSTQRSITISTFIIEGFSPLRGPVGRAVTVNGRYFGEFNEETDAVYFTGVRNDKGPSSLYVDNIEANIVSWERDRIRVAVPLGATIGPITVMSDNTPLQTDGDFECTSPYILSVSPDPATAGEEINFYGANFGPPDGMNKLLVDDDAYGGVFTSWSDDHVVAILPPTLDPGLSKLELLVGVDITNPYYCFIVAGNLPFIDKITPGFGEAGSASSVEILGGNFGNDINKVTVWFNGVAVSGSDLETVNDTAIELQMPAGTSRTGEVHVIVDELVPLESNHYLYHTLPGWQVSVNQGVVAGANVGVYSDVAYDASGQPYVVFGEKNHNSSGVFLYLAYQDAGEWVIDELASKYMNGEYRYPRVAVDTSGVVHFAYQWDIAMGSEVRYGTWDNGTVTDELVYTTGTGTYPGEYLDMLVLDDGQGGIDRLLVWTNELDEVMFGHKLDGASGWTTDVVYTADSAYSEQAGYYCSIDLAEMPVVAPPPLHAPSAIGGSYYVGISFGLYSPDYTPSWELHYAYSDDMDTWYEEAVNATGDPITETVMRWNQSSVEPFILWSTSSAVNWSYYSDGWGTEEVTSGAGPYGAALGLYVDISGDEIAFGHNGGEEFFSAYFDYETWSWTVETTSTGDGRVAEHVGRGGAAAFISGDEAALSIYDPDMRDAVLVELSSISGGLSGTWSDIADGFSTPGYDLSNRALVCDSNGVPHVVFGDIDPVTGERTLWMARYPGGGAAPPPEYKGWEFCLIDSAPSGTLGHATMAVDSNDDYHIAYLKGNDVMYASGSFENFSAPEVVFTPGDIGTSPRIALGANSPLDVNILVPTQPFGGWWWLYLLQSNDGMGTWSEHETGIASTSTITQYDLAIRHDGYAVAAGYETGPWGNGVMVWEQSDWGTSHFPSMVGMNAGITLTLDEEMHYSITATRLSDATGYLLNWDDQASDYVLDQFTASADGSTTMSQWRTIYGPFISYTNEDYFGSAPITEGWLYWDDGRGYQEYHVWSFDGENVPLRHSVDAYTTYSGMFAYYADVEECRYLSVIMGPAP